MASRPSRASSIPIPMPPSNTRSLENAISIPSSRTRIAPSSFAAPPPPLTRSAPRSSSFLTRASARQPYEPRVVRAPSLPSEFCPQPAPQSQGRRASTSGYPGRPAPRVALVTQPEPLVFVVAPEPFPRPAYLDHSTFRDVLRTEPLPAVPRKDAAPPPSVSYSAASAMTPSTDSDDDSSPPPRRVQATPMPTFIHQQGVFILPTKWSDTDRSNHLTVSQDKRDLTYTGTGDKDGASARTDVSIPPVCGIYYYEADVRGKEQKSHISIGFAGPKVKFNRLPGFEPSSWGYHGGDGFSFSTQRNGSPFAQTYGNGDTIGCGIDFSTRRAFYTKNGHLLGSVFEHVGTGIDLYPSIGLQVPGESVRVNFGHELFKFDIENHVQQQKTAAWNKIMATPLYTSVLNPGNSASTSASKSALSEEESKIVLNRLVLSYLIHHGYSKTVRAFQKQDIVLKARSENANDKDIEMDSSSPVKGTYVEDSLEDDIERRTRVVNAVAQGDIDLAITDTAKYHPAVLKAEASLMLFKLRCRKFVELILAAAVMKKEIKLAKDGQERGLEGTELSGHTLGSTAKSPASEGDWPEESMDMDVDDDGGYDLLAPTPSSGRSNSPASKIDPDSIRAGKQPADRDLSPTAQYEVALNDAIAYGQLLSNDYKADERPEVKQLFKQTFGIVAWEDPLGTGGDIAKFVSVDARIKLANELNRAILKSEGRPARPALETVYRHTSACVAELGVLSEGAAAFADLQRELLEA